MSPRTGNADGNPETSAPLAVALDALVAAAVEARVAELRRPELVTQDTVAAVVGIDARSYLRLARVGVFASTRDRRKVIARTADVLDAFTSHLQRRGPANDVEAEARSLARAGARRIAD